MRLIGKLSLVFSGFWFSSSAMAGGHCYGDKINEISKYLNLPSSKILKLQQASVYISADNERWNASGFLLTPSKEDKNKRRYTIRS